MWRTLSRCDGFRARAAESRPGGRDYRKVPAAVASPSRPGFRGGDHPARGQGAPPGTTSSHSGGGSRMSCLRRSTSRAGLAIRRRHGRPNGPDFATIAFAMAVASGPSSVSTRGRFGFESLEVGEHDHVMVVGQGRRHVRGETVEPAHRHRADAAHDGRLGIRRQADRQRVAQTVASASAASGVNVRSPRRSSGIRDLASSPAASADKVRRLDSRWGGCPGPAEAEHGRQPAVAIVSRLAGPPASRRSKRTGSSSMRGSLLRHPERRLPRSADASVMRGQRQPAGAGRGYDESIGRILVKGRRQAIHLRDHCGRDGDHLDRGR